ncbi:SDR family NAD(P)-dependent oxidoreductase [Agrococcus casei]|uniref:SDR family NAD(P)-dependent oxidoreductase n=1 Tax=Agrococcus casei TaxID=343512 RepID=UPI003F909581
MNDIIRGATVLVTGAARGMGAIFARRAAEDGAAAIALWDIDEARANELAAELEKHGTKVCVYVVDVSDLDAIEAGAAQVRAEIGVPDVLINNAGIVKGAAFWEHDQRRDIDATIRINTLAPMWLTRDLLPEMMADTSRPKRILNIVSAAATLPNPGMSVYAASKWAVLGWSESLRLEFVKHRVDHIAVTSFCPSYVSTGMFEGARGPMLTPILTPETATQAAWSGMLSGKPIVMKPWTVKFAMALRGVLPTRAWDVVAERMGVYSSMDKFVGRTGANQR